MLVAAREQERPKQPYSAMSLVGLDAREYGVVMCEREDGYRVTLLGDADHTRMLIHTPPSIPAGLETPSERYPIELE